MGFSLSLSFLPRAYHDDQAGSAINFESELIGVRAEIFPDAIASANDVPGSDPRDWQFQGSQNGTTWVMPDTRTGQTFASRFLTRQYPCTNVTEYTYYRLNITANNGDLSGLQLAELAFTYGTGSSLVELRLERTNGQTQLISPSNQIGWRLEMQTNASGLGTNGFTIPGSTTTNRFLIPTAASVSSFFRLVYL